MGLRKDLLQEYTRKNQELVALKERIERTPPNAPSQPRLPKPGDRIIYTNESSGQRRLANGRYKTYYEYEACIGWVTAINENGTVRLAIILPDNFGYVIGSITYDGTEGEDQPPGYSRRPKPAKNEKLDPLTGYTDAKPGTEEANGNWSFLD